MANGTVLVQQTTEYSELNSNTSSTLKYKQQELGVASVMSKTLRQSLGDDILMTSENYLNNKLSAKFRNLAKHEKGETGKRPIYLSKYGKSLSGFDFNSAAPFNDTFKPKFFVKKGSNRGQVILHFPSFVPYKDLKHPDEATNFKLFVRLVSLSDFGYDNEKGVYDAVSKEHHGKCASYESAMLPVLKMPLDPITTRLSLDHKGMPSCTTLFLIMAVCFYKYENGKFTNLERKGSTIIKEVF